MSKRDPQVLLEKYQSSGLTQKQFAEQESMSAPMVSYYLRKARQGCEQEASAPSGFSQIAVQHVPGNILITTPSGLKIEIPI